MRRKGAAQVGHIWMHNAFDNWAHQTRTARLGERALKTFVNRNLKQAFASWAEASEQHQQFLASLEHSMNHMLKRELSRGWMQWQLFFELSQKCDMLRAAIRRLMQQELIRGWKSWQAFLEDLNQRHDALKRGLSRMMQRELAQGFSTWTESAGELADQMRLYRKVLGFVVNRGLALGIASWRAAVAAANDMANALGFFLNRELARGWIAWRALAEDRMQRFGALGPAIGRLRRQGLSLAWGSWVETAGELAEEMRQMRKVMSYAVNRSLTWAMATWRKAVAMQNIMANFVGHLANRHLAKGFTAWHERSEELFQDQEVQRNAFKRIFNRQAAQAWPS